MLSRIRAGTGSQSNIQFTEIARVAAAIGPEEMIFLRLLRARLLDECADPRSDRIEIEITGSPISGRAQHSALRDIPMLAPRVESAIRNIIANLDDSGLRSTILWLGNEVFADDNAPDSPQTPPVPVKQTETTYLKRKRKKKQ